MAGTSKGNPLAELLAAVGELAREAIADARAQVIERGWFGAAAELVSEARELSDTPVGIALQVAFTPTELASPERDEAPRSWDTLCGELAQERASRGEPEREPCPEIER